MRGVLAHADVGDHDQIGVGLLQRPGRELNDALVVVGAGAGLVLVGGIPKRRTASTPAAWISAASATSSEIESRSTPGIDGTSSRTSVPAVDEQRLDQVGAGSSVSRTRSRSTRAPQAAHAGGGKGHALSLGGPGASARGRVEFGVVARVAASLATEGSSRGRGPPVPAPPLECRQGDRRRVLPRRRPATADPLLPPCTRDLQLERSSTDSCLTERADGLAVGQDRSTGGRAVSAVSGSNSSVERSRSAGRRHRPSTPH